MAKARPRLSKFGGAYTPTKTKNFEYLVKFAYYDKYEKEEMIRNTPIELEIHAYFTPTATESKSTKKYEQTLRKNYTKKPDIDNIAKAILDALNKLAYDDDKNIISLKITKSYNNVAKTVVTIKTMEKEN